MKCHYCKSAAEYFCDQPVIDPETKCFYTNRLCDRPLCEKHRHQHGITFFCGEVGGVDSMDFCPEHHLRPDGGGPAGGGPGNVAVRAA